MIKRRVMFGIFVLVSSAAGVCRAADLSGNYIAQITRGTSVPQYARVTLKVEAGKVSGSWGEYAIDGTTSGAKKSPNSWIQTTTSWRRGPNPHWPPSASNFAERPRNSVILCGISRRHNG